MKKIIFAAAIMALGFGAAQAQETTTSTSTAASSGKIMRRSNPKTVAFAKANYLEKELNLTEEQKQKVMDIFLEEANNADKDAARAAADKKITEVLTKEQLPKYETLKANRKEAMKSKAAE